MRSRRVHSETTIFDDEQCFHTVDNPSVQLDVSRPVGCNTVIFYHFMLHNVLTELLDNNEVYCVFNTMKIELSQ